MRLRLALSWLCLLLGSSWLFRVGLAAQVVHDPVSNVRELSLAFLAGSLNDLAAGVLVSAPLLVMLYAPRVAGAGWARLTGASMFVLVLVQIVVLVAEAYFWIDFGSRLNRYVFQYLAYPHEVIAFLEDQLSISLLIAPLLGVTWLVSRPWRRRMRRAFSEPVGRRERVAGLALAACALVLAKPLAAAGPLRPSMFRQLNVVAGNGYLGVAHALAQSPERWDGVYPDMDGAAAAGGTHELLGDDGATLDLVPVVGVQGAGARRFRHVVLVIEESFGGAFWSDADLRKRYMPRFDAIAREGVIFDNVYATGTRTTRGMEAILHAFPPLPGISTTQRPGFESLPSLPRTLVEAGFHTVFVYGGWPGFTDFEHYWREIGFEDVLSRFDFDNRWFETSWGVADEILFDRVLADMDERTSREDNVFLATLTVSNHRPYDIPAGRIDFPSNGRRREYAVAYADWALGDFLERARMRPWFDETLFVLTADHGPAVRGDALVPVSDYAVPLLFYAPDKLAAHRDSRVASTTSVPATVLGLLGIASQGEFLGPDLMRARGRYDGFAPVEHDYAMGLLVGDHLVVVPPRSAPLGWVRGGTHFWPEPPDPEQVRLTLALFRSAHQTFYGEPRVRMAAGSETFTDR